MEKVELEEECPDPNGKRFGIIMCLMSNYSSLASKYGSIVDNTVQS